MSYMSEVDDQSFMIDASIVRAHVCAYTQDPSG